jgi:WS/DGAT/MGAT family acyltransferase
LHHVLGDGPAAIAAFGALLDLTATAPDLQAPPWTPTPSPSRGELLRDNVRRRGRELRRGLSGLVHLTRTLRVARRTLPAWREVLTDPPAPRTSLNRPVGRERRLALVRSRLGPAKQAARDQSATVNDVVLAAVAGGLRQLLLSRGEQVEGLVQRAMVTISHHDDRPGEAQGNTPGWMMVPLPVGEADPRRRLALIAAETSARKDKDRPVAGSGIFRFIACQRVWYRLFPRQRSVNLVVSNVPGPPVPLFFAGAPLLEVFPQLPPMGNVTLVVGALSYAGQLNITAAADRDGCPDVDVFADGVRRSLDELVHHDLVGVS